MCSTRGYDSSWAVPLPSLPSYTPTTKLRSDWFAKFIHAPPGLILLFLFLRNTSRIDPSLYDCSSGLGNKPLSLSPKVPKPVLYSSGVL